MKNSEWWVPDPFYHEIRPLRCSRYALLWIDFHYCILYLSTAREQEQYSAHTVVWIFNIPRSRCARIRERGR